MKISEIITDKYKLRIPPTVYYELLADVQKVEEEQESITKNNLGVDCISREQALVVIRNLYPSMPRVDFNGSLRKWVNKYKPYIECDDAITQLSSVTPQEPKTGHWIDDEFGSKCSCCGIYTHLDKFDRPMKFKYCSMCGAKMVEPQESEG